MAETLTIAIKMTDGELMKAVCDGDHTAYKTLVNSHIKSVSRCAYRILGNRNDAADICQETFLRVWLHPEKWEPKKSKLVTWLYKIAYNLCVDQVRKSRRNNFVLDPQREFEEILHSTDAEEIHSTIKHRRLNFGLRMLPENQRSALTLCHYSGFSNKEAAEIMNVSVRALESLLARARRSLKKVLSNLSEINLDNGYPSKHLEETNTEI